MSFSRYRLSAGVLAVGPALILFTGCSGGAPTEGATQAAATPAPAATAPPASPVATSVSKPAAGAAARTATPSVDRYANSAPAAPAAKPAVDFDGDAFKAAVANQSVVGDRYSR